MFDETNKYKTKGHFFYKPGDDFAVVTKDVPSICGVYYIFRLAAGRIQLVHIGKSGSVFQNGAFESRPLFGENYQKTQKFFEKKCKAEKIDALDIYWFVTMDKNHRDIPSYVEGLLMQKHFELYGKLPLWNESF